MVGIRSIDTATALDVVASPAEIHLLGGLTISVDGTYTEPVWSPRVQSLMGYLCIHADKALPRSHLAYMLWPDSTEAQARTNLRKAIHHIREELPKGADFLDVQPATLQLRKDRASVDVVQFLAALAQASDGRRSGSSDFEQDILEKAVALYGGELLPACYDDWILQERTHLHRLLVEALGRLAALLENRHHYRDAIRYAEQLLESDRWHEETYRQLMRLYALVGDRAAALHAYHTCATVLHKELNTNPSPETRDAHARLMQIEWGVEIPENPRLNIAARLVARDPEWNRLQSAWRDTQRGHCQMVVLLGEAGIGKTRLADEMLEWAQRQGILTARAVCYEAEGSLPFAPVASWLAARPIPPLEPHWLSEVARVVPDILNRFPAIKPPGSISEPWQRHHLFEALARALLHGTDLKLYVIDNIHWCDDDTLQFLHFLLRFRPDQRLLLLATARPEDLRGQSSDLITALAANGQLANIELPRLSPDQCRDLASQVAGRELAPQECEALWRETEGVPLFIVETVHADPTGERRPAVGTASLPSKAEAVIAQRLNHLTLTSHDVLEAAAVIGREFSVNLLRRICPVQETALLNALDDLWKHRLINERGNAYDFSHDKIREVLYRSIGSDRRKKFHRVIAEALEQEHTQPAAVPCAQIAAHFEMAGMEQCSVDYYARAASQAQRVFAADEALRHIGKAIALNREISKSLELFEQQGDLLTFCQNHEQAGIAYREALIACPQQEWLRRARLHRKYATVFARVNNDVSEQSMLLAENSLRRVTDRDDEYWNEWMEAHLSRLRTSYWRWNADEMTALLDDLAPVVAVHGNVWQKAEYIDCIIRRNDVRSRFAPDGGTIQLARERLQILNDTGDLNALAQGQSTLGFVLFFARQFDEADRYLREAAEKASQTGDHTILLISLCYLSLTHRCQGRVDNVCSDTEALAAALAKSTLPDYEGIVHANHAWLAYKAGRKLDAIADAREARRIWASKPNPYPVQWPALSVLIACAVADGNRTEALSHVQALADSTLMTLESEVTAALQSVLDCNSREPDRLLPFCEHAVDIMSKAGYL